MNVYTTTIHVRCPFQPVWDYYELEVESSVMIQCELIEAVCDAVRGQEATQESTADNISHRLMVTDYGGGFRKFSMTLTGRHGANCQTICRRQN